MRESTRKLNCIAIDDEPLALELIESHISKIPYLTFVGGFPDPMKALHVLKTESIDLIFLDINMPDVSGIDFLKSLAQPPKVVFTTAYDNYAIQGFELNAVDYLLKPVSFSRFLLAADRVLESLQPRLYREADDTPEYIFVKSEHNVLKVSCDDIFYVEGYKDYVKIFTKETRPILTINTIKSIENLLSSRRFARIHKSYIISVGKIKSFRNGKVLVGEKHIPIGDSYREFFNQRIVAGRI